MSSWCDERQTVLNLAGSWINKELKVHVYFRVPHHPPTKVLGSMMAINFLLPLAGSLCCCPLSSISCPALDLLPLELLLHHKRHRCYPLLVTPLHLYYYFIISLVNPAEINSRVIVISTPVFISISHSWRVLYIRGAWSYLSVDKSLASFKDHAPIFSS